MEFEYHRLARSAPKYAWWKALVTGAIALGFYLVLSLLVGLAFIVPPVIASFDDPSAIDDLINRLLALDMTDPFTFAFSLSSIVLMLPSIFLARLIMGPRPTGLISSIAGRVRWRWLAVCFGIALVVFLGFFAASFYVLSPALGDDLPSYAITGSTWLLLVLALTLTPFQSAAEEYVFRGYLLQTFGGWLKSPVLAVIVSTIVFALLHVQYNAWGIVDVGVFGLAAAIVTLRTGGLEAAIAAHVVNNTTLFVLSAFGAVDPNAGGGSPIGAVQTLITMAVFIFVIEWAAKRSAISRTRTVLPQAPVPPQSPPTPPTAVATSPVPPTLGA